MYTLSPYIYIYICYTPPEPHVGPCYSVSTNRNCHFGVTFES